jgi:hypothetical protein
MTTATVAPPASDPVIRPRPWSRWIEAVAASAAAVVAWTAVVIGMRTMLGGRFQLAEGFPTMGSAGDPAHLLLGLGLQVLGVVLFTAVLFGWRGHLVAGRVAILLLVVIAASGAIAVHRSEPERCVRDSYSPSDVLHCTSESTARTRDLVRVVGPPGAAAGALLFAGFASTRVAADRRRRAGLLRPPAGQIGLLTLGALGWSLVFLAIWGLVSLDHPIVMDGYYSSDGGPSQSTRAFFVLVVLLGLAALGVVAYAGNRRRGPGTG